jgi:hypothetical protein
MTRHSTKLVTCSMSSGYLRGSAWSKGSCCELLVLLVLEADSFEALDVGSLHARRPWLFRNRRGESMAISKQKRKQRGNHGKKLRSIVRLRG